MFRLTALRFLVSSIFTVYPSCHCGHSRGLHYAKRPHACSLCDCARCEVIDDEAETAAERACDQADDIIEDERQKRLEEAVS